MATISHLDVRFRIVSHLLPGNTAHAPAMTTRPIRVIISKKHGGIYNYRRMEHLLSFSGGGQDKSPKIFQKKKNRG